jgi:hypothetical protein
MAMIAKINQLKEQTAIAEVKTLCESTINVISSAIYHNVNPDAQLEIETAALNNLFEGLAKYPEDKVVSEWLQNQKRIYSLKHLGVRKAVNSLLQTEAKFNPTLEVMLEDFHDKLDANVPEVLLYEAFISAVSGFNHLPAVSTELEAIASRVKNYKNDVDITKILEVMRDSQSNYLIQYIEPFVDNYIGNKTEQNKHFLKEALVKFSYDPFVKDLLNILLLDATELQLEYAGSTCDIEDKLFSPILYLGENEVLFNVKGTYYVKKQNNISKLNRESVQNLDESFKTLCNIINQDNIEVSKKDIKIFIGKDNAILTENETFINDGKFTNEQLHESIIGSKWGGNSELFKLVGILRENFDEIAELDFVKRVYLKENEGYAADVFKLRDNIFITTFDPINNKTTFYRNINPIQAEKVMMEHMRFDVSKTFADILPNKQKILADIETTKKEYSDYIFELENRIEGLQTNYTKNALTTNVLEALNEELEEVKKDYTNYLNQVETYVNVSENLNITVQDDQTKKSYTVVVPTGAMAAKGEGGENPESAEGDQFGTEVGMAAMKTPGDAAGASSAVTFDDDEAEYLSDTPSDETDKVDLDADDLEAYADKVDAETELNEPEEEGESGEEKPEGEEELGDKEAGTTELDLEAPEGEEKPEGEEEKPEGEEEEPEEKKEAAGPPDTNLAREKFKKEDKTDQKKVPQAQTDSKPKVKKTFLIRKKQKPTVSSTSTKVIKK